MIQSEQNKGGACRMGKAIFVAPPLKMALNPGDTAEVTIKEVRIVKDQWTSIGTLTLGMGVQVEYGNEQYSALFSLDRSVVTGSAGRLLVAAGVTDTNDPQLEAKLQTLVGRKVKVYNRGGKLYWYP
jgi:acetamidase/formamidase